MNQIPHSHRLHIGIFGRRNAGKSSLLNALASQNAALVSPIKGTTTDPVYKTMELLPIGPVVLIDTAGIDDDGELGHLRIEKTTNILRKTDIALLVVDPSQGFGEYEEELIRQLAKTKYLVVYSKSDMGITCENPPGLHVSAISGFNIYELKEKIAKIAQTCEPEPKLVGDLLEAGDVVILVIPIDSSAPKGRLILPQQQVIRDCLDVNAICIATQPQNLKETLLSISVLPRLVITDSQAFNEVTEVTPPEIPLTSFSILMARFKGVLDYAIESAKIIDQIQDGDKILIAEGCTHHRQCDDIGTVKIPRQIEGRTGSKPVYNFTSGGDFPQELSEFKLIIHCGGCMQNRKEMQSRQAAAISQGIPMTNYGIALSYMQGILERVVRI